ncbi:DNA cytosine methyltransferase [Clostridium sardiniense]|uniref:DNA (cytosine-5-)-methyltransferase n=1 Tax=Clostridium sardiniense TaxID=29369 RepID=A0ABS7KWK0_CLOSR|nr:DNA cytosine methyltransferase [Clostridium sardiniense]MBY0755052.1 DNA cytosine methyltransferase [Clostridium sardiniense]MDQ0459093.1 DNA (cytosine-5)-methyltransferase 3A [Clostridium sardiniense]
MKKGLNVLSLFDGISCGQVALERAGIKVNKYYASEICDDSIKVTQDNYPNTIQVGDVTKLTNEKLRKFQKIDMLIGGSPCQDLSKAKQNGLGLAGDKSKLFFEYVRILNWIRKNNNPDVKFLLENVKPNKETIDIITKELESPTPIEINSVLVSAQRRIRLYWTNINNGNINQPNDKGLKIKDIIYDNSYKNYKDPRIENTKVFTKNYIKYDLSGKGYYSQQDRAYFMDGTMCTLMKSNPINKLNIWLGEDLYRRCNPIEAERLQTLPDNYTKIIKSDSKRIGLCGDGWTVDVISHIFKKLNEVRNTKKG